MREQTTNDVIVVNNVELKMLTNDLGSSSVFISIDKLLLSLNSVNMFITDQEESIINNHITPDDNGYIQKYMILDSKNTIKDLIKKLVKLGVLLEVKGLYEDKIRIFFIEKVDLTTTLNTKSSYRRQLNTKEWKNKRVEVLSERGEFCEKCGAEDRLQIHHKQYINGRKAWEYDNTYLEVLCKSCHIKEHNL